MMSADRTDKQQHYHQAFLHEKLPDKRVRCLACHSRCTIPPGLTGECGVRQNVEGDLALLVYGKVCSVHLDPIEKKPMYHFLPGSKIMSIGTVGCNFTCSFCQNWNISQCTREIKKTLQDQGMPEMMGVEIENLGYSLSPQELVDRTVKARAPSMAFTYNEPTIFTEYAYDCARLGKEKGLRSVYVTNGYESPDTLKLILPYVDGMNIDLKSFRNSFYQKLSHVRLAPVLDTIKRTYESGCALELTTLLIPGENDSSEEMRDIAQFIKGISPDIPWHVSAFHPDFQMTNKPRTPSETLLRAVRIGKEAGLNYVYTGNIVDDEFSHTYCPRCKTVLIHRGGYHTSIKALKPDGTCGKCGWHIPGVWAGTPVREWTPESTRLEYPRLYEPARDQVNVKRRRGTSSALQPDPVTHAPPLRILFGTQSGAAEEYSRSMAEEAVKMGYSPVSVSDLAEYDSEVLPAEKRVIIITSTYGEGEPPDGAVPFSRWLHEQVDLKQRMLKGEKLEFPPGDFSGLEYAVFGLGRKQYGSHFGEFAKFVDHALEVMGGKRVYPCTLGDDTVAGQLEQDWNSWIEGIKPVISQGVTAIPVEVKEEGVHFTFSNASYDRYPGPDDEFPLCHLAPGATALAVETPVPPTCGKTPALPLWTKIIKNERMSSDRAPIEVRHVEIDISTNPGLRYSAGDHLGLYPRNRVDLVQKLCRLLDTECSQVFTLVPNQGTDVVNRFSSHTRLDTAFTWAIDITSPVKKSMLKLLLPFVELDSDRQMIRSLLDDSGLYNKTIITEHVGIVDLLTSVVPSCHPPPELLLEHLPKQVPRYYSIASSSLVHQHEIHLTVAVLKYKTEGGISREGLCSSYLAAVKPGDRIPGFIRASTFHLPRDPTVPVIMIAGGCGIAPFRGFLQEREYLATHPEALEAMLTGDQALGIRELNVKQSKEARLTLGPMELYFGCRYRAHDFLYGNELERASQTQIVTGFYPAFSRDQEQKIYVTRRMLENKSRIWELVGQLGGNIYMCGSASGLGISVKQTLIEIAEQVGKMNPDQAKEWYETMRSFGRIKEDLYSINA